MLNLVCHFDGACEPKNPGGNMGVGACIHEVNNLKEPIFTHAAYVKAAPPNSNNVAEYLALESLLDWLIEQAAELPQGVEIRGDSMLVIMQMQGKWKIKNGRYVEAAERCREKLRKVKELTTVTITWIPRGENKLADELSKKELINNGVHFHYQPLSTDHLK